MDLNLNEGSIPFTRSTLIVLVIVLVLVLAFPPREQIAVNPEAP